MLHQYHDCPTCEVCDTVMEPNRFLLFLPLVDNPILTYKCPKCGIIRHLYDCCKGSSIDNIYRDLKLAGRTFQFEFEHAGLNYDARCIAENMHAKTIIDMGSGSGGFENFGNKYGLKTVSFDVCQELIDFAATKGITVYPVNITSELEIRSRLDSLGITTVDCLYCSDIFEHLPNPLKVLRMWSKFLTNDGYILITLPNISNIKDEYRAYQVLHINYFTPDSFNNLITVAGYKIVDHLMINENNNAGTGLMKFVLRKQISS